MRSLLIVRSIHKTVIAVAALVAAMAIMPTSANANTVDRLLPTAASTQSVGLIQVAVITRDEARDARRSIRESLREPCRSLTGRDRRSCNRQARRDWRDHRRAARQAYRDCRRGGTSRGECRQSRRAYWVNEAGGGDSTGGGSTGGGDDCRCDD